MSLELFASTKNEEIGGSLGRAHWGAHWVPLGGSLGRLLVLFLDNVFLAVELFASTVFEEVGGSLGKAQRGAHWVARLVRLIGGLIGYILEAHWAGSLCKSWTLCFGILRFLHQPKLNASEVHWVRLIGGLIG